MRNGSFKVKGVKKLFGKKAKKIADDRLFLNNYVKTAPKK